MMYNPLMLHDPMIDIGKGMSINTFSTRTGIAWNSKILSANRPRWGYVLSKSISELSLNRRGIKETQGIFVHLFEDLTRMFDSPYRITAHAWFKYAEMLEHIFSKNDVLATAAKSCGLFRKYPAMSYFGNRTSILKVFKAVLLDDECWILSNNSIDALPDESPKGDMFFARFSGFPLPMVKALWNRETPLLYPGSVETGFCNGQWISMIQGFNPKNNDFLRREIPIIYPSSKPEIRVSNSRRDAWLRNFLIENDIKRIILFGDKGFFPEDYASIEIDLLFEGKSS